MLQRGVHARPDVRLSVDVTGVRNRLPARALDLRHDGLARRSRARGHHDLRAGVSESEGERSADTAAAAGDEGDSVVEREGPRAGDRR